MTKAPIRVVVTGAAGQISYSLLALIAKGDVFGQDQPIDLVMLDLSFAADAMKGVQMELQVKNLVLLKRIFLENLIEQLLTRRSFDTEYKIYL